MSDDRSSLDTVLDVLVYAPLGIAVQLQKEFPALVERGRQAVTHQGAMYKAVGEFAVGQVKSKAEEHAGGIYDLLSSVGLIQKDEPAPDDFETADTEPPDPGDTSDTRDDSVPARSGLPIDDYETLPAAQIVPMLAGLGAEEQSAIGEYEAAHRGRRTILGRLQRLAEQRAEGSE